MVREVDDIDSPVSGTLKPFRHQVDRDDAGAVMLRNTRGHIADWSEAQNDEGSSLGNGGVLDGLPRGGEHVREIDEAIVRRSFRHLDVRGLRLRGTRKYSACPPDTSP